MFWNTGEKIRLGKQISGTSNCFAAILEEQLARLKENFLSQIETELCVSIRNTEQHSIREEENAPLPGTCMESVPTKTKKSDSTPELPHGSCTESTLTAAKQPDDATMLTTMESDLNELKSCRAKEIIDPKRGIGIVRDSTLLSFSASKYKEFDVAAVWTQEQNSAGDKAWQAMQHSESLSFLKRHSTHERLSLGTSGSIRWRTLCQKIKEHAKISAILPASRFNMIWCWVSLFVLAYELFMLPLRVFTLPDKVALWWLNTIAVVFWTFDTLLNFFVGYFLPNGQVEIRFAAIAAQYAQTWLVPDLVVLAADWFLVSYVHDESGTSGSIKGLLRVGKTMRYVRILRLLRLRKLLRAYHMLEELLNSEYFTICFTLIFNFMCMLFIGHYLGCLWYLLGTTGFEGEESWVPFYKINETSWTYQYLTSLHWSLTQFTPGGMHVQPQNVYERGFGVMVLCCGMIAFSSIVSSITSGANQLKAITNRYRTQRTVLRRFLKEKKIDRALVSTITRYADIIIQPSLSKVDDADAKLLNLLPVSLRMEVYAQIFEQTLRQHPLFEFLSRRRPVFRQLCSPGALQVIMLSDGDQLFEPGGVSKDMFFVKHGALEYVMLSPGGIETERHQVRVNSWLCEAALWTSWVHQGYLEATSDAVLLSLGGQHFQSTLSQHHAEMWIAQAYAAEFVRSMNEQAGLFTETTEDDTQLSDLFKCQSALDKIEPYMGAS